MTTPRHPGLFVDTVDKAPLHDVIERWRSRHGGIEEPCTCGQTILAISGSAADVMAAVARHQVEPVHIAHDIARGIPLSGPQTIARGIDGYTMPEPIVALVGPR